MTPKWQKLASLAQEICTLWFQLFDAVFASKGYPYKNIFHARLFVDSLWSPAGKGLTSWLSVLMSYCDVDTFPLVFWVGCGA